MCKEKKYRNNTDAAFWKYCTVGGVASRACLSCVLSCLNLLHLEQQKPPPGGNTYLSFTPTESYSMAYDFKVLILILALPATIQTPSCAATNSVLSHAFLNTNVIFGKAQIWNAFNLGWFLKEKKLLFLPWFSALVKIAPIALSVAAVSLCFMWRIACLFSIWLKVQTHIRYKWFEYCSKGLISIN